MIYPGKLWDFAVRNEDSEGLVCKVSEGNKDSIKIIHVIFY